MRDHRTALFGDYHLQENWRTDPALHPILHRIRQKKPTRTAIHPWIVLTGSGKLLKFHKTVSDEVREQIPEILDQF